MCIIVQKTYYQSNDSYKISDRVRRCEVAINAGIPLCSNATRTSESARIIEVKPETSTSSSSAKKGEIVTESNGHQHIYRPIGHRPGQSHKTTHRKRSNDRGSAKERPASPLPTRAAFKTERLSPTPRPTTPGSAPPRMDSFPPSIRSEPSVRVNRDGTAFYEAPPSLSMPRAMNNERRRVHPTERKVSLEHDSTRRQRRPSLSVNTGAPQASPTRASPGLSRLPSLRQSHKRTDSAHDVHVRTASPPYQETRGYAARETEAARQRAADDANHRRQEQLEAAENRQLDREAELARDRHSLDHLHRTPDTRQPYPSNLDSEAAQWSRNTSPWDGHRRPVRMRTRFASSSPLAPRSTHRRHNYGHATVHQYHYTDSPATTSHRPNDSIYERGREVIERERARVAGGEATTAAGQHWEPVFDEIEERISAREYYYTSEGNARREIRRRRDTNDPRRRDEWGSDFFHC